MSHIGLNSNPSDFEELICDECMAAHQFLWKYNNLANEKDLDCNVDVTFVDKVEPNPKKRRLEEEADKDITKTPAASSEVIHCFNEILFRIMKY